MKAKKPRAEKSTVECTFVIPHDLLMYTLKLAALARVTHGQAINVLLAIHVMRESKLEPKDG